MKKRIFSLLVTLVVAISVVLGISLTTSAADADGLVGHSISLAENVTLVMEVAITDPADGAYAEITIPGKSSPDTTQLVAAAKEGDNYYFYAEVAIKDIAETVTVKIPKKDGTELVVTDSVLKYCEQYTEGEFVGLVAALKVYANAADYYFDPTKTVTEPSDADFEGVADANANKENLPAGITHRSATLLLESETTIRHYFELASGKHIDNYQFFVDLDKDGKCDVNEKVAPKTKLTEDGKTVYYVDIAGLTPNMLDEVYTIGVEGKADGKVYTCDYGVLTYLKRVYENGDNDTKYLAAAILGYSAEAAQLNGDITFNANGGSVVANQTYEYGVAKPIVAPTAKDGAIFLGWYNGNELVTTIPANATGDIALTAKWYKAEKFSSANFKTGFTKNTSFSANQGTALHEYFFKNGERYTNEVTLSFDILWADYTEQQSATGTTNFRFIDRDGKDAAFLTITDKGLVSQTGDTLSKTEATNIKVVFDASDVVYGDGVADKLNVSYYVGGVYKTTKTVTLTKDISQFGGVDTNGSSAPHRAVFVNIWTNITAADAKITNFTITDTGTGCAAVSPDGTVATYTPGTVTKLPAPTKDGFKFAGWYADEALTQPIDEIPANAAGVFNVYPKWIEAVQYNEYDYAQDEMLVASLVYCDHVDEGGDGKCDTCTKCVFHFDANNNKVCDVCGLARCGNTAGNHTDANSDTICDVCGLSDKYSVGYGSKDIGGVSYNASGEWSTGYAKGVAGDNGGYLVVAREYGDGPSVNSTTTGKTIKSILDKYDEKVLTYEFEIKKNENEPVLGFALRFIEKQTSNVSQQFGSIGATTNGVTLTSDEFVKVAYVIDFDAKEIRLYADGVYAGSTPITYGYENFILEGGGFLQMRLSGTGSICIDSIGIYAGDLYR